MLYRLIAPVGSGKKAELLKRLQSFCENREKTVVIVPEQITADYEREILTACGAVGARFAEVTNFSRLSNVVLRHYGELSGKNLSSAEKKLVLARILKEGTFTFAKAKDPDGVDRIFGELEELHLAGLDAAALAALAKKAEGMRDLPEKLTELALLQGSFRETLEQQYTKTYDDMAHLAAVLDEFPFFSETRVILDGFWDFTAPQKALIRRFLRQAKEVFVTFAADPKDGELFALPLESARAVLRMAREEGVEVEDIPLPSQEKKGDLAYLAKHLTGGGAPSENIPQGISLVSCKNAGEQALMIADRIRSLVEEGASWRDIAILSRNGDSDEILKLTLENSGIPCFLEEKRPLLSSPLAQSALLACKIACGDTREEVVRRFLSKGFLAWDAEERGLLERYTALWSLSGRVWLDGSDFTLNPAGYDRLGSREENDLAKINRAKEGIFLPIRHLAMGLQDKTVEEKVVAVIRYLASAGTEKELHRRISQYKAEKDYAAAGALLRNWNTLLEKLSLLSRALGNVVCSDKDFLSYLEIALSGDLPGAIPPGQDRVQIGRLGFHRAQVPYLFLPDLNHGVFPAPLSDSGIINAGEREWLEGEEYYLAGSEKRYQNEYFLFYLALSSAQKELILSYTSLAAGEKETGALSLLGKRVLALFPKLPNQRFDPRQVVPKNKEDAFSFWVSHLEEDSPLIEDLKDYFSQDEEMKARLLDAGSGKVFAASPHRLDKVLPYHQKDLVTSYSGLSTYHNCPFSFFAGTLLDAKGEVSARLKPNHAGTFVHDVLQLVLEELYQKKRSLGDFSEEELTELNQKTCKTVAERMGLLPTNQRAAYLVRLLSRSSLLILKNLRSEFLQSQFTPIFFEKSLMDLEKRYTIPLDDGTVLCFKGKIDRVDLYVSDKNEAFVRVVDYKTGGESFSLEKVGNGLNLQMLIYLFALCHGGFTLDQKVIRPQPAGILYLNGLENPSLVKSKKEMTALDDAPYFSLERDGLLVNDPDLLLAQDAKGTGDFLPVKFKDGVPSGKALISRERLDRLRGKVEGDLAAMANALKAGKIEASPLANEKGSTSCQWCAYRPICRHDPLLKRPYRKKIPDSELFGEEENA